MYATPEKIASANKANVETLMFIANTAFASAERLAALNLNTARGLMEDTVANTKAIMSIKNPQELLALQKSLAQPALDKTIAYSRAVYEIATQTQEVMGKLVEGQVAELNRGCGGADSSAESSPRSRVDRVSEPGHRCNSWY